MKIKKLRLTFLAAVMAGSLLPSVSSANCISTGQQIANENGGTLTKADLAKDSNGNDVCVIIVLVPGKDGERPKRLQVEVAAASS